MKILIVDRPGFAYVKNSIEEHIWNERTRDELARRYGLIEADIRVMERGETVFDHNAVAYYLEEREEQIA